MKGITIRFKIMAWFAFSLLVIMCVAFAAVHFILKGVLVSNAESVINAYCAQAKSFVEVENGTMKFDENMSATAPDIYFQIYNNSNESVYIYGLPGDLRQLAPQMNIPRTVVQQGINWLILDEQIVDEGTTLGWVRAARSLQYIDDTLNNLLIIFLILIPVCLFVAAIIGFFVAKKSLHPIDQITMAAQGIGRGDLSRRLNMKRTRDEVGRLSETFDEMIERLDTAFQREKRFTSDASHELRTPVSVISAYAENALSHKKSEDNLIESMQVIQNESKKMSTIISQLLMLTRGDDQKYEYCFEHISLNQSILDVVSEMDDIAKQRNITISVKNAEEISIDADQTLMTHLFLNLLDNAIKYNYDSGKISITIKKGVNKAIIVFEDTGIGIPPEDLPKVYERFFRAEHSSCLEGSGLGLSIVKWIVEIHKGTISINSTPSVGTTVLLELPLPYCSHLICSEE